MSDVQRQLDGVNPQAQFGPGFNPGSSFVNGNPFNTAPLYVPLPANSQVTFTPPFAVPQPGMSMKSVNVAGLPGFIPAINSRGPSDDLFPQRQFVGY